MISFCLIAGLAAGLHSRSLAQTPDTVTFSGDVMRGEKFSRIFHDSMAFVLDPIESGWEIGIFLKGRPGENIARLTPPFHSVPNPRFVEGWHFRNESNTGPNDGSVNAPGSVREFIFSSKVGLSMEYPPTVDQLEEVKRDGTGMLEIIEAELGNLFPEKQANVVRMRFRVMLVVGH